MDLIVLVLSLALVGFLVYLVTTHIPMPAIFRTAIMIIVVVVVILFLIRKFAGDVPNLL